MTTVLGGAPVTPRDLTLRGYTGDPTVGMTRVAESWRALNAELPGLAARMSAGLVDQAIVVDVICAAALRVLSNPEAHTDESAGVDDYTESWKRSDDSTDLYFTAAELRRLSGGPAPTAGSFKYS